MNEINVDENGNCEFTHPFMESVGLSSHEFYGAKFIVYFVAGKDTLTPLSNSSMSNPYAAISYAKQYIERFSKRIGVRYIAGVIAQFNDERPDFVIYYSTKGIKV